MSEHPILSHSVDLSAITAEGIERTVSADVEARARIAEAYDLVDLRSLVATAVLRLEPKGVIAVEGRVAAEIVQTCVVSLEPVVQTIDEPFLRRFVRAGAANAPEPPHAGAEIMVDPEAPDPPEPFSGTTLDLGPIVTEHFVLAIDPYPHAPGAVLEEETDEAPEDDIDSPFAALAALRGRDSGPS